MQNSQIRSYNEKENNALENCTYDERSIFRPVTHLAAGDPTYVNNIKELNFIIRTDYKILIPLEIIFKLLHTSETIPLIKYNPGNRFENIYRLYTNKNSKRGKKIPFLSKSKIIRLRKNIGKHKQVSVYISIEKYEIICSFEKRFPSLWLFFFDNV